MGSFVVGFSKLNIKISAKYDYTEKLCKSYIVDAKEDFEVTSTDEKIQHEIDISEFDAKAPYAECICMYREIAEKLPIYDRCVFHGAVISYNGKGYLFTAPSGTGKTTHICLWKKYLGDKVDFVNGDKPILQFDGNKVIAYATPYAGKEGYENHSSIELAGIIIVSRSNENYISKEAPGKYLPFLMNQMYRPVNQESAIKSLDLFDKLLTNVPLYKIGCDISKEAFITSFEGLTGEKFE